MGTYYVPRNVGGETRILIIFTIKSLITTAIGGTIGLLFYLLIGKILKQQLLGAVVCGVFALIGFAFGAVKIPTIAGIKFTKNIGGESIDEILKRYIKFKMNKKIYTYTKEENKWN